MKKGRVAVEGQSEGLTVLLSSFKRNRSSLLPMKETRRGEWWIVQEEVVVFQDGSSQPDNLHQGLAPQRLHLRSSSLRTVKQHLYNSWHGMKHGDSTAGILHVRDPWRKEPDRHQASKRHPNV
ncbi:hypothetical protein Bbelb_424970 [Branchiostoma belcheri]|nr:hypothetical protein Bbelb_424970 [Branchiostoma belcheri]